MNPEQLEQFFVTYLNEHHLQYKVKERIYTVTLDKTHQKWYNLKELTCTFDPNIARQKKCLLLGVGNVILDSMLTQYTNKIAISHLKIKKDKKNLLEVNDKLLELNKPGIKYTISEQEGIGYYALCQTTINSAKEKKTLITPILLLNNTITLATNIESNQFNQLEIINKDIQIGSEINTILKQLPQTLHSEIEIAQKNHEQELKEYESIRTEHSEDQYKDLQKKEDEILAKIEETKEKSITASSFNMRNELELKIKELRKKHTSLLEKHKELREQIKQEFDKQLSELKHQELTLQTKIVAYAQIELSYFLIEYKDKGAFYYIPAIKEFVRVTS